MTEEEEAFGFKVEYAKSGRSSDKYCALITALRNLVASVVPRSGESSASRDSASLCLALGVFATFALSSPYSFKSFVACRASAPN